MKSMKENLSKQSVGPLGGSFYYPSLDGLRFFAFLVVFLHHVLPSPLADDSYIDHILLTFKKNGWVGVDLFFVLSGFLITMLLLKERDKYGNFSVKNFWVRRSLRIWPLYFLALITGFFIIPFIYSHFLGQDYTDPKYIHEIKTQLPLYATFLGNWAVVQNSYSSFSNIAHLWTISLEEQFYLVWPLILMFIRNLKSTLIVGIFIIISTLIYRYYLNFIGTQHPHIYTNTFARIDILVFGALIALIMFYRPKLLSGIRKIFILPFQILSLVILSYILYRVSLFEPYLIRNGTFGYLVIALFMSYYTLSALQTSSTFARFLSWKPYVWLGKISYGLYVWHILGIETARNLLKNSNFGYMIPLIAFIITIAISYISYRFFESAFLRLKTKFTKITSRPI